MAVFQPAFHPRTKVRKLTSSSSPARGLEGLEGGGMLWEGARRGGILETNNMSNFIRDDESEDASL